MSAIAIPIADQLLASSIAWEAEKSISCPRSKSRFLCEINDFQLALLGVSFSEVDLGTGVCPRCRDYPRRKRGCEAIRLQEQNEELRQTTEKMRREIGGLREALAASRLAIEAFHQRDYSAAVALYDQALRADPNNAYLLNLKAYSLFELKRINEAIETQRQSLQVNPDYAWGYFDLARFQCSGGLLDEARRSVAAALEKRPNLREIMAKDGEFQRLCGPVLKQLG